MYKIVEKRKLNDNYVVTAVVHEIIIFGCLRGYGVTEKIEIWAVCMLLSLFGKIIRRISLIYLLFTFSSV